MMSKNNKEKANIYTHPFATPAAMMLVMKDGGQQELLDQVAMQPDKNYNERVNAYINKVKQLAMDKVQEEMLDTSMSYGEEADNIMSMIPMAQMGMQFSPQAYKTVDAFTQAAKPKKDMGKLFTNALFPTMFSKGWKENTPIEDQYSIKFKGVKDVSAKDLEKYYEKPKAQKGMQVKGAPNDEIVRNPDGSVVVYQSNGTSLYYANDDNFKKNYVPVDSKKAQTTKELPTTLPDAGFTIDPKAAEVAREAESAKYAFSKDTNRASKETTKPQDGNVIEGSNEKPVWQPEPGPSSPADLPNQNQYSVGDGLDWFRALIPGGGQRGALMKGNEPEAFFAPNTVVAGVRGDYRFNPKNIFRPEGSRIPGALKSASILFGEYDPQGAGIVPYGQSPQDFIPVVPNQTAGQQRREERQTERAEKREDKAASILDRADKKSQEMREKAGIAPSLQERLDAFPTTGYDPVKGAGYANVKQRLDYLNQAGPDYQQDLETELSSYGFKKGGSLDKFLRKAQMGQENPAPGTTKQASIRDYKFEDWINDVDAQVENEQNENPGLTDPTAEYRAGIVNPKEAKYKVRSKNPYAAPAILAGMNVVAGALENRNAMDQQRELMNRLSFDQMSTELRGSDGDYAFNTGMFRPDQMVPVQFTGYNNPMSQFGGAFEKDQEYYLDDNTIQEILNAGGEIEYLD